MCPLSCVRLMLHSSIFVAALVINYVQLPACPATPIYSMATSISIKKLCGSGGFKSDWRPSYAMAATVASHRNRVRPQNGLKPDLSHCEAQPHWPQSLHGRWFGAVLSSGCRYTPSLCVSTERIVLSTKGNERMMAKVYEDITSKGTALFHRELLQPPKH